MKNLILFVVVALVFIGCDKDKTNEEGFIGTCELYQINNSGDPTKTNFEYDENGKITQVLYERSGEDPTSDRYKYTYSKNNINLEILSNGKISDVIIYELDGNKNVIKKVANGQQNTYKYNSQGYLLSISLLQRTVNMTYADGNLSQVKSSYYTNNVEYNTKENRVPFSEHEFYVFEEGPMSNLEDAILYEQGYFGKVSKNQLLKSSDPYDGNFSYSFNKNENGKALSAQSIGVLGGFSTPFIGTLSYSYKCK